MGEARLAAARTPADAGMSFVVFDFQADVAGLSSRLLGARRDGLRDGVRALPSNVRGLGAARANDRVAIVVPVFALAFFAAVPRAARLAPARGVDIVVQGFGADRTSRQEHRPFPTFLDCQCTR